MMNKKHRIVSMVGVIAASLTLFACAGIEGTAEHEKHEMEEAMISLNALAMEAAKSGQIAAEQSAEANIAAAVRSSTHDDAVTRLVLERNIPVSYEYVATLMRQSNAFGEGAACVMCHSSNDPAKSYRGLDLSSCEGIKRGSMEEPQRKIIYPGKKAKKSLLRNHLRNNRMPFGVAFDYPTDAPNIIKVKRWIAAGAKNDANYKNNIQPLWSAKNAFGSMLACTDCHMSNQEPPSFHELDMTSYEGVMLGADALAKAEEGLPPVKIVKPGNPAGSKLYQRLTQNRMPAGISPAENRDHPNTELMISWIKQGASCK